MATASKIEVELGYRNELLLLKVKEQNISKLSRNTNNAEIDVFIRLT